MSTNILSFTLVLLAILLGDSKVSFQLVLIVLIKIRLPCRSYKAQRNETGSGLFNPLPALQGHNNWLKPVISRDQGINQVYFSSARSLHFLVYSQTGKDIPFHIMPVGVGPTTISIKLQMLLSDSELAAAGRPSSSFCGRQK